MTSENRSPDLIRDFVIASHGDFAKVKTMLAEHPTLLNLAHAWNETDHETAIQAAAQVGNREIAEYLLSKGAPLSICTAAMLGRQGDVERLLNADAKNIKATGAHGIPLLAHAALSGNLATVQILFNRGAQDGTSMALHNAVRRNDVKMATWLLENSKPDLSWKDYQGKTSLEVATERGYNEIASLLKSHGTHK